MKCTCKFDENGFFWTGTGECPACVEHRAKAEAHVKKSNQMYKEIRTEHLGWTFKQVCAELHKRLKEEVGK